MKKIAFYLTVIISICLLINCERNDQNGLENEHFGIKQKYKQQQTPFNEIKKEKDVYMFISNNQSNIQSTKKSGDYDNFSYIIYKDSSKITTFYNDKVKTYTLPIVTSLEKSENDFFNLIIKKHNGKTSFFVVKYSPEKKWNKEDIFKGKITFLDKKGRVKGSISTKKTYNLKSSNCIGYVIIYGECGCGGNADGHPPSGAGCCNGSPAIGYEYNDCGGGGDIDYGDISNGSGISDGGGTPTFPDTISDLFKFKEIFESNGIDLSDNEELWLYNHPDKITDLFIFLDKEKWSSESKNFTKIAINAYMNDGEVDFEERIIYEKSITDNPCANEIVKKIEENDSEISNFIMSAFGGDQNKVNLTYKLGNPTDNSTGQEVAANTRTVYSLSNQTLNATVTLSNKLVNQSTDLLIATYTIHENLHAVLGYAVRINNLTTSPDPDLYELSITYAKWMKETGKTTKDEHAFMATIVDKIATSLQKFGESKGYQLPEEYYNDLSWSGKIGLNNPTYLGLKPEKRSTISRAFKNEDGDPNTVGTPKGTTCN